MFGKKRVAETRTVANEPPASFEVIASVQTDKGCVREINEDSGRYVRPSDPKQLAGRGSLLIVADGMGGHSAGEVASQMAADVVSRVYYETGGEPEEALRRAVEEANRQIHEAAAEDSAKHGMGTTCTALALRGAQGLAAHVGDSRLYMLRGGQLYQLSEDHSAVNEMVKLGLITKDEARTHEDKNVILRALGTSPEVEVSMIEPFPARVGDKYLLCSDGLYDLVRDEEIAAVLTESKDIHAAGERLIALAKERGGHDNITVGILAIMPEGASAAEADDVPATRELEAI
ncbi:MAG TPA: Stp1/IreP family PP2C-type Ser/Thr phosphatase [Pyrinomonadaceae bacterium]|nr:Stp1/IreP family PP2C-type Ser/Thr phosphatase [Pyrinomonadaceae bacterium]